jgi:hypothetical protein
MVDILARYGIKEVADVTFYDLDESGNPKNPVLFLDTLKVSTIEQTAEQSEARGGKGNPPLIIWDYGKEINVTLEDALFSAKSMAIMFGNGSVKTYSGEAAYIMKTEQFTATDAIFPQEGNEDRTISGWRTKYEGPNGELFTKINPRFFDVTGNEVDTLVAGNRYFCTFDLLVDGAVIEISANSFPGTYYVTGDTYARSEASGKDEMFQFIIPKAKVQSENTITLEAEGDPSVFNMSLRVMRPADGQMMKLVKYNLMNGFTPDEGATAELKHNHNLGKTSGTSNVLTVEEGKTAKWPNEVKDAFDVFSYDETIATAVVESEEITVTGVTVGKTNIFVRNADKKTIEAFTVEVVAAV